jgi:hypothetical protein
MNMTIQFILIYEQLEKIFKLIGKSYKDMHQGESIQLESPGLMDLVVSRLTDDVIALEHNYIQNGDLMVDPRIDIKIHEYTNDIKMAEGLNYEQHNLGIYQEVYSIIDGKRCVNTRLKKEVNSFLLEWLNNIEIQSYSLKNKSA